MINIISIDMKKLLKMYLLERRKRMLEIYDAFELLKRRGAKLPTDNYEFVKE